MIRAEIEIDALTVEAVAIALWNRRREIGKEAGVELDSWDTELDGLRESVRSEAVRAIEAINRVSEWSRIISRPGKIERFTFARGTPDHFSTDEQIEPPCA